MLYEVFLSSRVLRYLVIFLLDFERTYLISELYYDLFWQYEWKFANVAFSRLVIMLSVSYSIISKEFLLIINNLYNFIRIMFRIKRTAFQSIKTTR